MTTIHIDCDGVLCDFTQGILDSVESLTGCQNLPEQITDWDILANVAQLVDHDIDGAWLQECLRGRIERVNWCADLFPYPGVREVLDGWRDAGHTVHVVTTPWATSQYWHWERTQWLRTHCGVAVEDVTFTTCKARIGTAADIFIDDSIGNVVGWASLGRPRVYLMDRPYNRGVALPDNVARITTLEEIDLGDQDYEVQP